MEIKLKTQFTKATFTNEEFLSSHDIDIKDFEDYIKANGVPYSENELKAKFLDHVSWVIYSLDLYELKPDEEINDSSDPEILNWEEVFPLMSDLIVVADCCRESTIRQFNYCSKCGKQLRKF